MSRVVHFEVPTSDPSSSRKFYENVFGWQFKQWGGPVEYWLITTGEPGTPGIDGGLGGAANEFKGSVNTVDVANLDETLAKVLANGGKVVMPKEEIPGVGWLAYVQEPGGAFIGLMQTMPNAQM
jgi:predicted enzyme related to lactoylglutathione lyase